jgi:hypothetical protein
MAEDERSSVIQQTEQRDEPQYPTQRVSQSCLD